MEVATPEKRPGSDVRHASDRAQVEIWAGRIQPVTALPTAQVIFNEHGKTPALDSFFKVKASLSRNWYDD